MATPDWQGLIALLRDAMRGIRFERGLSDREVEVVEARYGFRFPPDLRELLRAALPFGSGFPDWRHGKEEELVEWIGSAKAGVLFDVEHNDFWLGEWGSRPEQMAEALAIASRAVDAAPRLIPVFGHRMIPDEPHLPGNPVFSVHQTDIIVYGVDLDTYLRIEFNLPAREPPPSGEERVIRFWDPDGFQSIRWKDGGNVFDNSKGILP